MQTLDILPWCFKTCFQQLFGVIYGSSFIRRWIPVELNIRTHTIARGCQTSHTPFFGSQRVLECPGRVVVPKTNSAAKWHRKWSEAANRPMKQQNWSTEAAHMAPFAVRAVGMSGLTSVYISTSDKSCSSYGFCGRDFLAMAGVQTALQYPPAWLRRRSPDSLTQ